MNKFRYRSFKVYQDTLEFRTKLKNLTKTKFPKNEQYALTSQLWRALDSIILNIAEGADRGTDKDFAHFLNNSHTSLNEVVACLDLALSDNYIAQDEFNMFIQIAEDIGNQLTAFRQKLLLNPKK